MKVRAIKLGYYNHSLRKPGAVFNLKLGEKEFSQKWMEKVEDEVESKKAEKPRKKVEAQPEAEMSSGDEEVL